MTHPTFTRRTFPHVAVATLAAGHAAPAFALDKSELAWHDPAKTGIEGKGWSDTKRFYDRLPAKAEAVVRKPEWDLSRRRKASIAPGAVAVVHSYSGGLIPSEKSP